MSLRDEWKNARALGFSSASAWRVVPATVSGRVDEQPPGYALAVFGDKIDRETLRRKVGDPFAEDV